MVSYNAQVGQLNKTVDTFSNELARKPEEGIYLGEENKIEIYFNVSKKELVHTIAHELGHSLGISHNEDKEGIMYPYTTEEVKLSAADISSLNQVCKKQTFFDKLGKNLNFLAQKYLKAKE